MTEWIAIGVAIVAIALSAYAYYRSGRPVTLEGVQEAYTQSQTLATELSEVAAMGVAAAQQLKESGKILTNEDAFSVAFDHIERWFPGLDRHIVANAVEGAYNLYKLSKPTDTTPPALTLKTAQPLSGSVVAPVEGGPGTSDTPR